MSCSFFSYSALIFSYASLSSFNWVSAILNFSSIIGQGQIERILSGKPEERRELFDEAAGIVKYKRRKVTAQKKLESERENLVRVNDILTELERQVGPLEKQSETARIYLKKKEELKTLDVNMFLLEMERIETQTKEVEEKFNLLI